MVIEVALTRKIQVQMWAVFGLWYKYGQSGATSGATSEATR